MKLPESRFEGTLLNDRILDTEEMIKRVRDQLRIERKFPIIQGGWFQDYAVFMCELDLEDKIVLEFGGRDSILGPLISKGVKKIYMTDNFEVGFWWEAVDERYNPKYWIDLWTAYAQDPGRMIIERQNIENTSYPWNYFDVIVGISVLEHIASPVSALREIHRILQPGGIAFISTETWEGEQDIGIPHSLILSRPKLILEAGAIGFEIKESEESKPMLKRTKRGEDYYNYQFFLRKKEK